MLKKLAFEIKWRLRELIREQGAVAVMHSDAGKKLSANLAALEKTLQQGKAPA